MPSRKGSSLLLATTVAIGLQSFAAGSTDVTWNGGTGSWSDHNSWTPGVVPNDGASGGMTYDALIHSGTATLDFDPTITGLTLDGGTISDYYPQTLTVNGLFNWSNGGSISVYSLGLADPITVNANGGIAIAGGPAAASVSFVGAVINNAGAATWSGADIVGEGGGFFDNSVFNNLAGATFDAQDGHTYTGNTTTSPFDQFNNAGTFTKDGYATKTLMNVQFNNSGTVNVNEGTTLEFAVAGTHSGKFMLNGDASVNLVFDAGGTFESNASIVCAGTQNNVIVNGGTSEFKSGSSFTGGSGSQLRALGGIAKFDAGSTFDVDFLYAYRGAITLDAGEAHHFTDVTVVGSSSTERGELSGSDLIETFNLDWLAYAKIGSNGVGPTIDVRNNLRISGSSGDDGTLWEGGTINNHGAATLFGDIDCEGGRNDAARTTFNNLSGATFEALSNSNFLGIGLGNLGPADVFNNAGTVIKSAGTGATTFYNAFNNSGTVSAQTGTIAFVGGGDNTGSYAAVSGTTIEFGGPTTFESGSSLTGPGGSVFDFSGVQTFKPGSAYALTGPMAVRGGATAVFNATVGAPIESLTLDGGTIDGTATINVTGQTTWTDGGQVGGSDSPFFLSANGGLNIVAGPNGLPVVLATGTLINNGTATWTGAGITNGVANPVFDTRTAGGTFTNGHAATFNATDDQTYAGNGAQYGVVDVFNNLGNFSKSGGSGTTLIQAEFNNSGQVFASVGTLELAGGGTHTGAFHVGMLGTLQFDYDTDFNAGSLIDGGGTVVFNGGVNTFEAGATYAPTSGQTVVSGGTVLFNTGNPVAMGGDLTVKAGSVLSGGDAITVQGGFAWTDGGQIGADGFGPQLAVTGTTMIGGAGAPVVLAGGSLTLADSTWKGAGINATGAGATPTVLSNLGTLDAQDDQTYAGHGDASAVPDQLNSYGTFQKSGGTGSTIVQAEFNNYGSLVVQSGTVNLAGGGTVSGSVAISSGATLTGGSTGAPLRFAAADVTNNGVIAANAIGIALEGGTTIRGGTLTGGFVASDVTLDGASNGPITLGVGYVLSGNIGTTADNSTIRLTGVTRAHFGAINVKGAGSRLVIGSGANGNTATVVETDYDGTIDAFAVRLGTGATLTGASGDGSETLTLDDASLRLASGAAVSNLRVISNGRITSDGASSFSSSAPLTNNGIIVATAPLTVDRLTNYNPATHTLSGGSYYLNAGGLVVPGADIVTLDAGVDLYFHTFVDENGADALRNLTAIAAKGSLYDATNTTLNSLTNAGALTVYSSTLTVSGAYTTLPGSTTLVSFGKIVSGSFINAGTTDLNVSSSSIITGTYTNAGGTIRGTGTINAAVRNSGTIAPGHSPGQITITNGLVLLPTSIMDMQLGGTAAGSQFDQVTAQSVAIDGALKLSILDGYVPAYGFSHRILGATSSSGVFSSINGIAIETNRYLAVTYSNTGVDVTAALPGDADLNGTVDFDDLVRLAQNYRKTSGETWALGDFDGNGAVDFDDLVVLAQFYRHSAPASATIPSNIAADWALAQSTVPEPTTLVLIAGLVFAGRRKSRCGE